VDGKVYTPDEIAQIFQISKHTVYELIKRGELNAFKIGNKMRIEQSEVDRFKEAQKAPAQRQSEATGGTKIDVIPQLRLAGSHDLLVEHLVKFISKHSMPIQPTYIGSLEGLMMLYRGQCDIAAIHLLDPISHQYNIPFIQQLFIHEEISLIRFAAREQGLIIAKGNPKKITGLTDLARADVRLVNRQKGSGTRFLLDSLLAKYQINPASISGYELEEWNHLSAASHISRGAADVAFGIQAAASNLGLDFIPISREQFDLVCKQTSENSEALKKLIDLLNSEEILTELKDYSGYDLRELGKTIYHTQKELI
jgi:putative molybdopterin biosynthesis protein